MTTQRENWIESQVERYQERLEEESREWIEGQVLEDLEKFEEETNVRKKPTKRFKNIGKSWNQKKEGRKKTK